VKPQRRNNASSNNLPDLLQMTREVCGEEVLYRFANGLTIKTEILHRADRLRILPLGSPQASLMNHMLNFPRIARNKRVFEPFAGSGALGFMALKAGAAHVDLLDINPRALDFQRENAELNGFSSRRFTSMEGDIVAFAPEQRYDLILANPPFVPTPEGLRGAITSDGGPEGNRFVEIVLERLEELIEPSGQALIYVFQLVKDERPVILELLSNTVRHRSVELTPSQEREIPFETYREAYTRRFPKAEAEIDLWRTDLLRRYGSGLSLRHYVVDVGPRSEEPTVCAVRENFAEKFGKAFLVPAEKTGKLALARVSENFVPAPGDC
jgi:methylase of polypeptide subunit release factors